MKTPRVFHRVWYPADETDVIPAKFEGFWQRWQELHPDAEFITHDDLDETESWISNKDLFRRTREAAAAEPENRKDFEYGSLPDIVRYEIIAQLGGVYVDVDMEPLQPFDELLERGLPFIGWESFDFVCCAMMGGPAGHPAALDLVENLEVHATKHWRRRAVDRTGPRFITERWIQRDDVLRLPPAAFFPVCWDERDRLGGPYPEESLAVHHWNAGWIPIDEQKKLGLVPEHRTVVLIPWRGGDPDREFAWEQVRSRWETSEVGRIFTGDSPGATFNRAAAINAAAAAAGEWKTAVIADADTWDNISAVRRAVKMVERDGGAVVPWNERIKLSREGTDRFSRIQGRRSANPEDRDPSDPTKTAGVPAHKRGGAIVVSREAWDAVGGFDEGFVDWGHEDRAFRLAIDTVSKLSEVRATVFHMFHELASLDRKGTKRGRARFARYEKAHGDERAMQALLTDLGLYGAPDAIPQGAKA